MLQKTIRLILMTLSLFFCASVAAQADTVSSLFRQAGDPVIGNPKGSITVVEFFDYQCPHCRNMVGVLNSIARNNANVRVVLKDLPVLGPTSEYAARAALAAKRQGKYMAVYNALMSARGLNQSRIIDIAGDTGVNKLLLEKDMSSASVTSQIRANQSLADSLGIPGTPAILVGATNAISMKDVKFAPGAVSENYLQKMINDTNPKKN